MADAERYGGEAAWISEERPRECAEPGEGSSFTGWDDVCDMTYAIYGIGPSGLAEVPASFALPQFHWCN